MRYPFIILTLFFTLVNLVGQEVLDPNGYNKIYYPNGSLQSEGNLLNGKPEGYWINYFPTGVKKSEGIRTNHQLDSIWVFYNIIGDTIAKINYLNGKKNGYYYKYVQKPELHKGNVSSQELYVNDNIEGTANYFYPSGKIKEISSYENNLKEGKSYEYAEDGRLISIFTYRKGDIKERVRLNRLNTNEDKVGLWQEFYEGYRLKRERYFKDGLLDGYYKEYDPQGKLTLTLLYRDGILVEEVQEEQIQSLEKKEFYTDGTIKKTGFFIQDKPVGVHKEFDRSGEVTVSYIYNDDSEIIEKGIIDNDGKRIGSWQLFFADGSVKASGKYVNNRREGTWKFFFPNGQVEQTGNYIKGKYNGIWTWYYPTGELWKEEEFYNGKEEGFYIEYDLLGNTLVEGEYFDGEQEGKWKTMVNDYRAEGSYVTGLIDGRWRHYHDNGALAFDGNYVQGNAEGRHRYFYANGSIKEEQYYSNGIREKHWKKYNELGELIITISYKNNLEYRINGIRVDFPLEVSTVIE